MDAFKKGWFTETGSLHGDNAISIEVDKILHREKTPYQDILVFTSKRFGVVLVLDNAVQCSEADEFSYQEIISFLPLNSHPNPKKVLVIGGGDGGVIREVVKHPCVESVILCEIDERVIEVSKEFLPFMAKGFDSPKATIYVGDGAEFVRNHPGEFDVIITDSSDPIGPAQVLFQKPYYESLNKALKEDGILCSQGESFWFDLPLLKSMLKMCREIFPVVDYATSYVPTYPGGQIGYLLCGKSPKTNFRNPIHKFSSEQVEELKLKYYTSDIHRASFTLPLFVAKEMNLYSTK
ncbi:spermidine synthase [Parasteatoda tepidariorum]|nr:spermidine synthase [Parasteatoda tepidariorum]